MALACLAAIGWIWFVDDVAVDIGVGASTPSRGRPVWSCPECSDELNPPVPVVGNPQVKASAAAATTSSCGTSRRC
jgi:hypothetical protein